MAMKNEKSNLKSTIFDITFYVFKTKDWKEIGWSFSNHSVISAWFIYSKYYNLMFADLMADAEAVPEQVKVGNLTWPSRFCILNMLGNPPVCMTIHKQVKNISLLSYWKL
jgi:hypothetical protein